MMKTGVCGWFMAPGPVVIFLIEIDEETGYPIYPEADEANHVDSYYGKKLLGGYHNSIEGPHIMYD